MTSSPQSSSDADLCCRKSAYPIRSCPLKTYIIIKIVIDRVLLDSSCSICQIVVRYKFEDKKSVTRQPCTG